MGPTSKEFSLREETEISWFYIVPFKYLGDISG